MKARPIIFNGQMVRAILDGRKTQTRRIMKPQPNIVDGVFTGLSSVRCPFGKPGDRLWVRETFAISESAPYKDGQSHEIVIYRADQNPVLDAEWCDSGGVWKPSIHMPRWASRITLEIVKVDYMRLKCIGHDDCLAEGVTEEIFVDKDDRNNVVLSGNYSYDGDRSFEFPIDAYADLWESINGSGSWDANPIVWIIKFRRVP